MSIDVSTIQTLSVAAVAQKQAVAVPRVKQGDAMKTEPPISTEAILSELTEVSAAMNKRLTFSINEKLDQVVVKVVDTATDKVIREIPLEALQRVHERIREVIGILFDERA